MALLMPPPPEIFSLVEPGFNSGVNACSYAGRAHESILSSRDPTWESEPRSSASAQPEEWEVPRSRFWPHSVHDDEIQSSAMFGKEWNEELGLHPSSHLWSTATVMMIRNIPGRCLEREIENLIKEVTAQFRLEMPRRPHGGKCKGYAFVTVNDTQTMQSLAQFFWCRRLHNR
eukprot:symbB.v1.2.010681.t1/scaffold704.1/size171252/7